MVKKHNTEQSFGFQALSISDDRTKAKMKQCLEQYNYWIDPHTAVGLSALDDLLESGQKAICLSTAHPIKFKPTVEAACQAQLPDSFNMESALAVLPQRKFQMPATVEELLVFFRKEM